MLNDDPESVSKSSSKNCTTINTDISKTTAENNSKSKSKPNKSYPKFTTVQNKQLILLPLPDDFLRLNISNTNSNSDVRITISHDTRHDTNSQPLDSPTHFRLSEVRTTSSSTPFLNNISSNNNSSNNNSSNTTSANTNSTNTTSSNNPSSKNSHVCSPECPNSHRYEALPSPKNENKTRPEPTLCLTNLALEPPPAPLPRHPTPQCTPAACNNSKPEFANSKNDGWQRFD